MKTTSLSPKENKEKEDNYPFEGMSIDVSEKYKRINHTLILLTIELIVISVCASLIAGFL